MKKTLAGILSALIVSSVFCGCGAAKETTRYIEPPAEIPETDIPWTEPAVTEATTAETQATGLDLEISDSRSEQADEKRSRRTEITGDDTFTVMMYLCGTDLETECGAVTDDILEMVEADITDNVNILLYTGGTKEWQNTYISNETNQIWKVVHEDIECIEEDMGLKPMNEPETLTEFVSYCGEHYPANRNALILWDHGGGALMGFGLDEIFGGDAMQINEIDSALDAAGVDFDFIGFDACLMSTVETACMIDNHADYMIASEESEPAGGWFYTNWLNSICADPSMPTEEIGKIIIDDFVQTSFDDDNTVECVLSLIDLTEMNNVFGRLCDFSSAAKDKLDTGEFRTVSSSVSNTKAFGDDSDMIDLMHFAQNLDLPESDALIDAIDEAVVYSANSKNINNSNGLTIYLPYSDLDCFNDMIGVYNDLGLGGSFTDFVLSFANVLADCRNKGGSSDPMSKLFTGNEEEEDDLWNDYDWFDEDYSSSYDSFDLIDSDDLEIVDRGDFYVLELSDDDWDMISDIRMQLYYDDGEGYFDMGTDDYYEQDDDGALMVDFDGLWFSLGDYMVPLNITETEYYTEGQIGCFLNGEYVYLIVRWDNEHDGDIIGARREYESGVSMKGLLPVNDGDTIELVCEYYDYDGNFDDFYCYGEPFEYDSSMTVDYYPIGEGSYIIYYIITDIYNNKFYTETVTLDFTDEYFHDYFPEYYE